MISIRARLLIALLALVAATSLLLFVSSARRDGLAVNMTPAAMRNVSAWDAFTLLPVFA